MFWNRARRDGGKSEGEPGARPPEPAVSAPPETSAPAPEPEPDVLTDIPRIQYKRVWDSLSDTRIRAMQYVVGSDREQDVRSTAKETVQILARTVGFSDTQTMLEIGCGIGRVGQALAPVCREWIGCDVSGRMLEHARARLQGVPNVRLVELSGYDLQPIDDRSIDVVYCTIVFMHLEEWERYNYVCEAFRVLRPGGRFYVDNFTICTDEGWKIFETHRRFLPGDREPQISKSSTPQELETYLRRAGFVDLKTRIDGALVRYWAHKPR